MSSQFTNLFIGNICTTELELFTYNLTSSYTPKRNELTTVPASLIMFILTGLFFNLNLFSGISDVSAILEPKVRLFLSLVLSIFLPVMSYLFSEAKNIGDPMPGLSLKARVILEWMLLVELLRRKVDEIRVRGYSGMVQRAGRVVWLGSLVFFNISVVGQKALFSIIWVLCVTRLVQRIAFAEVEKRSYAHGKNPGLISSYMAQMQHGHKDDDQVIDINRCRYIVMGEEKLVKKVTAYGYELNDVASTSGIITVGKVCELAESDQLFAALDQDQRLRRLCLSFALFKLLRQKFEQHHLAVTSTGEARDSRDLILTCLHSNGGESKAEAVFQVMNDEVNFLCEYNHSVAPIVLASPFFILVNYVLIYIAVFGFCLMVVLICGNGDVEFALHKIFTDNFIFFSPGFFRVTLCILMKAINDPPSFFMILDFSITVILLIIFFYEEIWEFLIVLFSNWFMVSLLCSYMTKPQWHGSPIFRSAFRFLMFLWRKMSSADLSFKQFSVLDLCWPPISALPATPILSLKVKTATVPNSLKQSIIEYIAEHDRGTSHYTPLTNGKCALQRNNLFPQLSWACNSTSVSEVILTWHIATSLLELECPPRSTQEGSPFKAATRLSKYCAYLVLFHPNLLPDNQDNMELFFEDIGEELKNMLGCWDYYFSSRQTRVKKIMESIQGEDTTETTGWTEILVDPRKIVESGAKLGKLLISNGSETVWKVLADVWTEIIIYIAASSDKEHVKDVLVHGGEFITLLWVLTMHTGISLLGQPTTINLRHPEP